MKYKSFAQHPKANEFSSNFTIDDISSNLLKFRLNSSLKLRFFSSISNWYIFAFFPPTNKIFLENKHIEINVSLILIFWFIHKLLISIIYKYDSPQ